MNARLELRPELSLLARLEQSQWWSAQRLARAQSRRLAAVVRHARETVPFYRGRSESALLTRRDIQDAGEALRSRNVPSHHGALYTTRSSGSTGEPVQIAATALVQTYWRALTLRDHLWHRRDLDAKLCSIRPHLEGPLPPEGAVRRGWGAATDALGGAGPMALLALGADVSVQADWLRRHDPEYLLSFPSNLLALAEYGLRLPRLREVRTVGETLPAETRERLRAVWNVPVTDLYSSQEVGVIAIQCPSGSGLYHVQSESLTVEVLDEHGRACAAGEVGRVVVSTLHNFAMPLLRYEIGDYAEVGAPCPCDRGLPTLARIAGRKRNMLVLPNGERRWPMSGFSAYRDIAPIRQYQLVQHDPERIEARFVVDRPVRAHEEQRLGAAIREATGYPFEIEFTYLNSFPRSAGGKFEDFVSMVDN